MVSLNISDAVRFMSPSQANCTKSSILSAQHINSVSKMVDINQGYYVNVKNEVDLNSSHTIAYNPNARRAYEKSQHAEDFGRIKLICSFNSLLQSHISA